MIRTWIPPESVWVPAELLTIMTLFSPNVFRHSDHAVWGCWTTREWFYTKGRIPRVQEPVYLDAGLSRGRLRYNTRTKKWTTCKTVVLIKYNATVACFPKCRKVKIANVFLCRSRSARRGRSMARTFYYNIRDDKSRVSEELEWNKQSRNVQWHQERKKWAGNK